MHHPFTFQRLGKKGLIHIPSVYFFVVTVEIPYQLHYIPQSNLKTYIYTGKGRSSYMFTSAFFFLNQSGTASYYIWMLHVNGFFPNKSNTKGFNVLSMGRFWLSLGNSTTIPEMAAWCPIFKGDEHHFWGYPS